MYSLCCLKEKRIKIISKIKLTMKFFPIVLTTLLLLFSVVELNAQIVTYSGSVEYYLEVSKTALGKGSDGGWNWNVSIDEKRILTGSFYVTFTGSAQSVGGLKMFKLSGIEENINYISTVNNEGNDERAMGKDMPDESRSRKHAVSTTRVNPEKPVITSGFLMFHNGKYNIMLTGEMEVSVSSELTSEETYPQNRPPKSVSETTTVKIPIAINGEKASENLKYLEGTSIQQNEQSDDCRICIDGNFASMIHGDMECSYVSKITTSWTLVKRNEKDCDAEVTYIQGDVKINGIPVKTGTVKVGAGDVITTGPKSRISFSLKNGNEMYRLGSKSKLQLMLDPCNTNDIAPISKEQAMIKFINGKIIGAQMKPPQTDWSWFVTTVAGVRGQLIKPPKTFYASASSDLSGYLNLFIDPEKEELLEEFENLPDEAVAFYLHFEDDEVKDFTVVKGSLKVEDSVQFKNKTISEGTTINIWDDGSVMTDIFVSTE
jgi:hypothetical protein